VDSSLRGLLVRFGGDQMYTNVSLHVDI